MVSESRQGHDRIARMCKSVQRCVRACEDMQGHGVESMRVKAVQVCEGFQWSIKVCEGMQGSVRVYKGV